MHIIDEYCIKIALTETLAILIYQALDKVGVIRFLSCGVCYFIILRPLV